MPYPSQLLPEPLTLRQSTADLYLHKRCSNTVLSQSLWGPWVLVCTRFVWAFLACLVEMRFDSKCKFILLPSCWGFSFVLGCGVSLHSCSSTYHLTGVSLTLDVGYLLTAAAPDLGHGVSPLSLSPLSARQPIANMDTTSSLICC